MKKTFHAFSMFIPTILSIYSNGFTRVPENAVSNWITENDMTKDIPQYVRKSDKPTVSKTRARAPTATVSIGLFSVKIWAMN